MCMKIINITYNIYPMNNFFCCCRSCVPIQNILGVYYSELLYTYICLFINIQFICCYTPKIILLFFFLIYCTREGNIQHSLHVQRERKTFPLCHTRSCSCFVSLISNFLSQGVRHNLVNSSQDVLHFYYLLFYFF